VDEGCIPGCDFSRASTSLGHQIAVEGHFLVELTDEAGCER